MFKHERDLRKVVRNWFPTTDVDGEKVKVLFSVESAPGGDDCIPDFFVFFKGEVHFIELKCLHKMPVVPENLRLRPKQVRFLRSCLESGINAGVLICLIGTEDIYFYDGKLVVDTIDKKESRPFKGRRCQSKHDLLFEIDQSRKFRNKTIV